ncbi:MAG: DNA mismatch repair protein [Planctomycetota bacterium]|nr:MAG: DNA mismatch repair protein [Planctomycetota bacterium]
MATPLMEQYAAIKKQHPDDLLFFRLGDFYEMFYEDAKTAARTLGITLTSRFKGEQAVPMAGVPAVSYENYVAKLLRAGFRVAVCEQTQDVEEAEGLVERGVVRVMTPGTLTEQNLLQAKSANFLAAACPAKGGVFSLAWADLSTGHFHVEGLAERELLDELTRLAPSELLVPENLREAEWLAPVKDALRVCITPAPEWDFEPARSEEILGKQFGTTGVGGFGLDGIPLPAAAAIVEYLRRTQRTELRHLARIMPFTRDGRVFLDRATQLGLELTQTMRGGDDSETLLGVLDKTSTAMGARLLRDWLLCPLRDVPAIRRRHDAVEELARQHLFRQELQAAMRRMGDLERLGARLGSGRANARDLGGVAATLLQVPDLADALTTAKSALAGDVAASLDPQTDLAETLTRALTEDPPIPLKEGGLIRDGFDAELDRVRSLMKDGQSWIARFQAEEQKRTGLAVKVGFNHVFGYYIEITHAQAGKGAVPPEYIRKQTTKNSERYITPALKEHETEVLNADAAGKKREYEVFLELRERAAKGVATLLKTAAAIAELDVVASMAQVAVEHRYARPVVDDSGALEISEGRHPVLERFTHDRFVPNDAALDIDGARIGLITGPNMAGKSTYIRQVALIVLMTQAGSFVPAAAARIGVVDRIFTRVGAADELTRGNSTFMVEMNETAAILHNATARSLIILDEIGRGTSTFDGLSIAWAVTEYLHDRVGARTLFATHYHELTELAKALPGLRNLHVQVRDYKGRIVFTHRIGQGPTDKSYGVHVAQLAGLPKPVIDRAGEILKRLEDQELEVADRPKFARQASAAKALQRSLFGEESPQEGRGGQGSGQAGGRAGEQATT